MARKIVANSKYSTSFIDPLSFTEAELPMIVMSDDRRGVIGSIIKIHEGGDYNHEMIMRKPGFVVSQAGTLKEFPITEYMKPGILMKFWQPKLTPEEKAVINAEIDKDLAKKWWQKSYDVVGIIGQALWMPWLQMPGMYFCSEWVAHIFKFLPTWRWIWLQKSPSVHNSQYDERPGKIKTVGYWFNG